MGIYKKFHPATSALIILSVILPLFILNDPICILIAFSGAIFTTAAFGGARATFSAMKSAVLIVAITWVFSIAFSDTGVTVWITVFGRHISQETGIFGVATGVMISAVVIWFSNMWEILSQDKLMYMIKKVRPSIGIVLSMVFSFIPRFGRKTDEIIMARRAMGAEHGNRFKEKIAYGVDILSSLMDWSFEHSIVTADSMKCRGFGAEKRTFYLEYKIGMTDWQVMAFVGMLSVSVIAFACFGYGFVTYFPVFRCRGTNWIFYAAYMLLQFSPGMIKFIWEARVWHLKQRI